MQLFRTILVVGILSICASSVFAENGMETLQRAVNEGKYLYLFIYNDDSSNSVRLQSLFNQTLQKLGDRVRSASIKLTDPSERDIIEKFDLKRAPMPLALIIASNGAVMGGFPSSFTEEQLMGSLASLGAANCLKALQDRKLVFLCLQNGHTTDNEAVLKGIGDFKRDARFTNASEVLMMDPSDKEEQQFLRQLGVNIHPSKATTVMIVPPGDVVGQYQGAVAKERLVSDLTKATSNSCCPGGCCPGGCCSPKR